MRKQTSGNHIQGKKLKQVILRVFKSTMNLEDLKIFELLCTKLYKHSLLD